MSRRAAGWLVPLCAAAWLAGCQRVGRGLVDELDRFDFGDSGIPIVGCRTVPDCDDAGAGPAVFEGEPLVATSLGDCEPCADDVPSRAGCPPITDLAALGALGDDAALSCTRQRAVLEGEPEQAEVTLSGLTLERVELALEARRPAQLVLEAARLAEVTFVLEGPITLRVIAPEGLRAVQVRGARTVLGAPRLHVEQRSAAGLWVGGPRERFEGLVTLARLEVTDSQLVADAVELESSTYYDGLIDATTLFATDCDLDRVELRLQEGQLAAGRVREVSVSRCGRLELLGLDSTQSRYAPCELSALRVYASSVVGGMFDGPIEGEQVEFIRVRFGQRAPTELTHWSGVLQSSAFCGHTHSTRFGGSAGCVACADGVFEAPDALCHLRAPGRYEGNFCEAFWSVPKCEPAPEPRRPTRGGPSAGGAAPQPGANMQEGE